MTDYTKIPTTPEVWTAIRTAHPCMAVFGSYSAPCGDHGSDQGRMFTSYGFSESEYPTIAAETTWTIDKDDTSNRIDETHQYWLCVPTEGEE